MKRRRRERTGGLRKVSAQRERVKRRLFSLPHAHKPHTGTRNDLRTRLVHPRGRMERLRRRQAAPMRCSQFIFSFTCDPDEERLRPAPVEPPAPAGPQPAFVGRVAGHADGGHGAAGRTGRLAEAKVGDAVGERRSGGTVAAVAAQGAGRRGWPRGGGGQGAMLGRVAVHG